MLTVGREEMCIRDRWYPKYGNLVPRDVATRAIFKVVYELGMGCLLYTSRCV